MITDHKLYTNTPEDDLSLQEEAVEAIHDLLVGGECKMLTFPVM